MATSDPPGGRVGVDVVRGRGRVSISLTGVRGGSVTVGQPVQLSDALQRTNLGTIVSVDEEHGTAVVEFDAIGSGIGRRPGETDAELRARMIGCNCVACDRWVR